MVILEKGTPVRLVDGVFGPACRKGVIVRHCPDNGGYLVRHDEPDPVLLRLEGVVSEFGFDAQTFGWTYSEVEPIQ